MIRPSAPHGSDARLVPVATGVELSVTDRGEGLPLVLLHGVSMSAAYFHPVIDPLVAAGYRVIVPDLRGHGRSPHVEGGHTVGQYADDVNALLDALDINTCVLVGWSMGNLVAWELMLRHGRERVAAHVNISQGPTDLQCEAFPYGPLSLEAIHGFIARAQRSPRRATSTPATIDAVLRPRAGTSRSHAAISVPATLHHASRGGALAQPQQKARATRAML